MNVEQITRYSEILNHIKAIPQNRKDETLAIICCGMWFDMDHLEESADGLMSVEHIAYNPDKALGSDFIGDAACMLHELLEAETTASQG